MKTLCLSSRENQKICQSMSVVIRQSHRPLADVRGLVLDLDRNGFTKDEIRQHLVRAIALARLAQAVS